MSLFQRREGEKVTRDLEFILKDWIIRPQVVGCRGWLCLGFGNRWQFKEKAIN